MHKREFVDHHHMLCPNCGKDLEKGSQFCIHCGFKIPPAVEREESRAERADRELREMAASKSRQPAEVKPEEPEGGRGAGVGLIIGGIVWMVIFFVLNYIVFTFGITKWGYGLVGAVWGLVFMAFMLGGLFFILIGILALITGKVYFIK